MITVSIDPGIRGTGVAVWRDKALIAAYYVVNPTGNGQGPRACQSMAKAINGRLQEGGYCFVDALIMEWPQVYPISKGDPNDLFCLAGVDAALTVYLGHNVKTFEVVHYKPREWKGQLDKEVMVERIKGRLTPDELTLVPDVGALTHNIFDSIGVGLHHNGRLQPKKVFAR